MSKKKVTLIGAGNVAVHLGKALRIAGYSIENVYSRTEESARMLASELQCTPIWSLDLIDNHSDFYIFAVKDDALLQVLKDMPSVDGIYIHTSGSVEMDIFKPYASQYGICYPLQTFSKNREIKFDKIPLFIEGSKYEVQNVLLSFARDLSQQVTILSSEKRQHLHLAAVFACNFTNHMYTLASSILEEQQLRWQCLLPLIEETAAKVKTLHPSEAQTGPAVRNDQHIIQKHLDLLKDEELKELYRAISRSITHQH